MKQFSREKLKKFPGYMHTHLYCITVHVHGPGWLIELGSGIT